MNRHDYSYDSNVDYDNKLPKKPQTAIDILKSFKSDGVIRQHNLLSTATDKERRETIKRVLDWWNFKAVPFLDKIYKETGKI